MEFLKSFIETKLTPTERVELIKQLMEVDLVYDDIKTYILDDLESEPNVFG